MTNSPKWPLHYLYDRDYPRSFPGPLSWYKEHISTIHHFGRNDMNPELSFDASMFPWALGTVLHKETFP